MLKPLLGLMEKPMSALPNFTYLSHEAYLLGENDRTDAVKYEYVNGQVYAMAGASRNHNRLARNLTTRLDLHLRGSGCLIGFPNRIIRLLPKPRGTAQQLDSCAPPCRLAT